MESSETPTDPFLSSPYCLNHHGVDFVAIFFYSWLTILLAEMMISCAEHPELQRNLTSLFGLSLVRDNKTFCLVFIDFYEINAIVIICY